MKKLRENIFETNSSSTHSLVMNTMKSEDYVPYGDTLKIRFFDEEENCATLTDKVSYLVSHIISWYKYDAEDYEDLIRQVKDDLQFKRIRAYVQENYDKRIVFPEKYDGDLEDIVNINHQLQSWDHSLDEILEDIVNKDRDYLGEVLAPNQTIVFGRD